MASRDNIPWELNEKRNSIPKKECEVCKEPAQGYNFGALVCLPCKSFYIRCSKEDVIYSKCQGNCDITGGNRISCQYCRYQQCLQVGMKPREKPERYLLAFDEPLCMVCGDLSNGIHFGVSTCEGCKKFFRRCLLESSKLLCVNERRCKINPKTRNRCRLCRYLKCLQVGMSKSAVKIGRPRKSRNLPTIKQKTNSVNAAYEDWVHHLLKEVKYNSPKATDSVSPSTEVQQTPPVQFTRILPPDVTNLSPDLHIYTHSGTHSRSQLNMTPPIKSPTSQCLAPIEMVQMQDYDCWPLPKQRVHYVPQQVNTAITHQESVPAKHCQSQRNPQQNFPRTPPKDAVETTFTIINKHDNPNPVYINPIPNCGYDLGQDQYGLKPNNSYDFQYSNTDNDDLLNLLEYDQQWTCESLAKSKSTSNIVSEAHYAAQSEINERSFWNCPEENLTQLYKSAEFLSLPNLTQLSYASTSKPSDVDVPGLSTPEFNFSDFIND